MEWLLVPSSGCWGAALSTTRWLVQLTSTKIWSSSFCPALGILVYMYYLCWPQKTPGKNSGAQVSPITPFWGALPPVQRSPDSCCQSQTPAFHFKVRRLLLMAAAHTWNTGELLLATCRFVCLMAAVLEMQNVMDYNVQELNTKK